MLRASGAACGPPPCTFARLVVHDRLSESRRFLFLYSRRKRSGTFRSRLLTPPATAVAVVHGAWRRRGERLPAATAAAMRGASDAVCGSSTRAW
ncbi:hypothetical protein STCU_10295 [Strigomonas culicis]|uniref:Uncharacterized protein n=1 Tax=Strigomonas culicis TaxID=28005 RepID=S9TNI8_9TRYP|nr:hypothetical protein STCU_10295 [Strigomonas culicis]|eukprot:EPY17953.1 hypothetical protein STCU_10295 [Strigomonas culicis]